MTKESQKVYYDAVLSFKYTENMLNAVYVPRKLVKYLEKYNCLREYIINLVQQNDLVNDYKRVAKVLLGEKNPYVMLLNSFNFSKSKEGFQFWEMIFVKIMEDEQKEKENVKQCTC